MLRGFDVVQLRDQSPSGREVGDSRKKLELTRVLVASDIDSVGIL